MFQSFCRRYSVKALPFESTPKNKYNAARSTYNFKPVPTQGLVHNPPQAIKSATSTPRAFLPKNDPRYLHLQDKYKVYSKEELDNMPIVYSAGYNKNYTITPSVVEEMNKLRAEDLSTWTISKLARHFNLEKHRVNSLTGRNPERAAEVARLASAAREGWSPEKRQHRSDRKKRVDMWLRNEF